MIIAANPPDYPAIIEVWELSVRATHHFLPEDYLQYIKELLPSILAQVPVFVEKDETGKIYGFLGVADTSIEMLFIHPDSRGKGIGRALTRFAIDTLGANSVEVNEQNPQALGFYETMGFVVTGRKALDGLGKPFPLLEMHLEK